MGLIQIDLKFNSMIYVAYDTGFAERFHYRKFSNMDDLKEFARYLALPLLF
jgi:hypothetical protein